ncbi:hypothetical protein BH23GEM10_BH23GEM10_09550 [soil metagenome]
MKLNNCVHEARAAALVAVLVLAAPVAVMAQTPDARDGRRASASAAEAAPKIANAAVHRAANAHRGMKIMVSVNGRRLLLVSDRDTLMDVPVAVGMGRDFRYEGRTFRFETPTGRHRVLAKSENPIWTVPDWHYMEKAAAGKLELVRLAQGDTIVLADGSHIVVTGDQVGRVNQFGNFWPFTPGTEIVFDGKIFMPPFGTDQRRVPEALGPYKLELGDGYLIHGTHIFNEDSVGQSVSHGCVRMTNSDLDRLYYMVDRGTPVFIY